MTSEQTVVEKQHRFAPPRWRIYEALALETDQWFVPRGGELAPRVIEAVSQSSLVWASLWRDRPDDTITFTVDEDGPGSSVRYVWRSPAALTDDEITDVRHRLNYALGGALRDYVDTEG